MSDCSLHQQEEEVATSYNKSQKFFFGQVSAKFGKNWSVVLVDSVNDYNYDENSVLFELNLIAKNIENRDPVVWNQSILNISYILDTLMQSLFPDDTVASNYSNVFDFLNETRALYSDVSRFTELVDQIQQTYNLTDYIENKILSSMSRDFSSAGYLWERMNQMLLQNASDESFGVDPDMQTKLLVSGS